MKKLRKLTVKNLVGKIETPTQPTQLYRVGGRVTGAQAVETPYGDAVKFSGLFVAEVIATGEQAQANTAYFPSILSDEIVAEFHDGEPLEFACIIGVEPADTNVGYKYTVETLRAEGVPDPAEELAARLGYSNPQALEGPPKKRAK